MLAMNSIDNDSVSIERASLESCRCVVNPPHVGMGVTDGRGDCVTPEGNLSWILVFKCRHRDEVGPLKAEDESMAKGCDLDSHRQCI
jgi:hypothetical protein